MGPPSTSSIPPAPAQPIDGWVLAKHVGLFALTVLSVLFAGALYDDPSAGSDGLVSALRALPRGWKFAVPLMSTLLVHELGHYIAARIHGVPASLPYFIPLPMLSPFGTMGAIISMPRRIRSPNALLDIGAAGPIAGLVVAIPVLCFGLATSTVQPLPERYYLEGQSLFYVGLKYVMLGPIPEGSDVTMNATAFAGWTGLLVTALNLVPVGQLDGGHIAYALFGRAQDRVARFVHFGLLLAVGYNIFRFVVPAVANHGDVGQAIGNSTFWLLWFVLLAGMKRMTGMNHPPTEPGELSGGRRVVAAVCLALFVLLFMPTPWAAYG